MTLKRLVLPLLPILLLCASCQKLPEGAGKWPKLIPASQPIEWSDEEKAVLKRWAMERPDIAKKIVSRNNELAALIDSYNRKARDHNRKVLEICGFDKEDIEKLEP